MTILLDTSVIIDALRRRRRRRELLRSLLDQGHELACCAINIVEVSSGMRPQEAEATTEFLDSLEYIPINTASARHAGMLRAELQRMGQTLSLPDAIIGAVAMQEDVSLATDNTRDFSGLKIKTLTMPGE
jgi:predicted nucleic acid-binding protein